MGQGYRNRAYAEPGWGRLPARLAALRVRLVVASRLIKEATNAGARTGSACREMGISMRTFQRWTQEGAVRTDGRPGADRPAPDNKLTVQERQAVLDTVNSPAYRSLPASQIVPALARPIYC